MKKSILNLVGAQLLSKNEQKEIIGAKPVWCGYCDCGNTGPVWACGNGVNCMMICLTNSN